jgi:hypothetical protein
MADEDGPRFQLAPMGYRGYMEARSVTFTCQGDGSDDIFLCQRNRSLINLAIELWTHPKKRHSFSEKRLLIWKTFNV